MLTYKYAGSATFTFKLASATVFFIVRESRGLVTLPVCSPPILIEVVRESFMPATETKSTVVSNLSQKNTFVLLAEFNVVSLPISLLLSEKLLLLLETRLRCVP